MTHVGPTHRGWRRQYKRVKELLVWLVMDQKASLLLLCALSSCQVPTVTTLTCPGEINNEQLNKFQISHWIVELRIFRIKHKTVFLIIFSKNSNQVRSHAPGDGGEGSGEFWKRASEQVFSSSIFLVHFFASVLGCEQLVSKDNSSRQ